VARSSRWPIGRLWLALACTAIAQPALAQGAPPVQTAPYEEGVAPPPAGKLFSEDELDELVARVALYPDPLLALVLPASTNAIQIVQAQRFLDQSAGDSSAQPPSDWDPAIISLCNYPEVIEMMSNDLDWTQALGDAVAAQQADVMDSIQQVRAEAQAAGNLETTPQQEVVVEKEVVKIVPADPQVIYVPQYDPQVIAMPSPVPVMSYYPPRPCYWCEAAAFGTGMMMGAATTAALTAPFWAFDWHHHGIGWHHGRYDRDFDFNVDIDRNVNINNKNVNKFNKQSNTWKPDKNRRPGGGNANRPSRPNRPSGGWNNPNRPGAGGRPGKPGSGAGRPGRPSGGRPAAGGGGRPGGDRPGAARPGGGGSQRPGGVAGRPSTRPAQRPSTRPATRPGASKTRDAKALGGYGRGQDAVRSSSRGAASRSHGSSGRRSRVSGGGRDKSLGGYRSGSRASAQSRRGSASRASHSGGSKSHGRSKGGGGRHRGGRKR
jgi:Protein of unknown function (DUF3300)